MNRHLLVDFSCELFSNLKPGEKGRGWVWWNILKQAYIQIHKIQCVYESKKSLEATYTHVGGLRSLSNCDVTGDWVTK